MANRKSLLVPNARAALEQLKFEIAQELGIELPADGYYGHMTTRDMGSIGGTITKRLIQMAEQQISGRY
ncbi:alpha/beta-type small acid-soluble spore protein [Paenibacillus glycanilyticus]|uniref:Acid-soluble spore protein n=1 Tax=Paenibacillus glycanilyticus TaxID=126569 RepID=A0ABQ6NNF0_9BACL|nr:alpha/beta-type small acid-soluble spore protein [Paenibacillus glycanilyticus]GMK45742.1 acid-soluble spore protein [Paenibacillus glycanilyticus]